MTATASDVALMSPYAVSDAAGSKFTAAEFDRHYARAQARLEREAPAGLSAEEYDQAHLLLICHLHALKLGELGMRSESIGSYSYTKDPGSSYLDEYRQLISAAVDASGSESSSTRCDAEMDDMDLDQSNVPRYPEDS